MRNYDAMLSAIAERAQRPFNWRDNDCAHFAAAVIKAQTGKNPLRGLRWKSAGQALRTIERLGGLESAVSDRLRRISPAEALRGDLAGVPDERTGLRLMIVEGAMLVAPGVRGLERQRRSAMIVAWSAD